MFRYLMTVNLLMRFFFFSTSNLTDAKKSIQERRFLKRLEDKKTIWRALVNMVLPHLPEDGFVTFDEFSALLMGAKESQELFNALDLDDSGVLLISDIRDFAREYFIVNPTPALR